MVKYNFGSHVRKKHEIPVFIFSEFLKCTGKPFCWQVHISYGRRDETVIDQYSLPIVGIYFAIKTGLISLRTEWLRSESLRTKFKNGSAKTYFSVVHFRDT